ncbi:hypothetical protein OG596_07955 [Streptomyces sp. NBC_01102]|uniref:hypothetical protein n=1 Tax=Streptomyces sp. NBC_01102 TaxID=2903749 RepID=UPI003867E816|nr:hypothetical protein OG596_07955 [Streptomyces sp. NBC_01102]
MASPCRTPVRRGRDASPRGRESPHVRQSALGFSDSGGLCYGTDTSNGEPVFVKEARPLTDCWGVGEERWDAPCFLRREFAMLGRLGDLGFCPGPVDLFEGSEHTFPGEQRVFATGMRSYWARNDVVIAPYIRSPGRGRRVGGENPSGAVEPIRMVDAVHRKGALIGDLSPENILIDPDSTKMWIVDFESAVTTDDEAPRTRARALSANGRGRETAGGSQG